MGKSVASHTLTEIQLSEKLMKLFWKSSKRLDEGKGTSPKFQRPRFLIAFLGPSLLRHEAWFKTAPIFCCPGALPETRWLELPSLDPYLDLKIENFKIMNFLLGFTHDQWWPMSPLGGPKLFSSPAAYPSAPVDDSAAAWPLWLPEPSASRQRARGLAATIVDVGDETTYDCT